uniref:Uncharacterized protein n=1 Tax=Setaria viridis TaxID=4556 RepID=A0A4U6TEG2_SETVI|nr:hypothetical protein SEVIR_8G039750v2 [Setaria viridis]
MCWWVGLSASAAAVPVCPVPLGISFSLTQSHTYRQGRAGCVRATLWASGSIPATGRAQPGSSSVGSTGGNVQ